MFVSGARHTHHEDAARRMNIRPLKMLDGDGKFMNKNQMFFFFGFYLQISPVNNFQFHELILQLRLLGSLTLRSSHCIRAANKFRIRKIDSFDYLFSFYLFC